MHAKKRNSTRFNKLHKRLRRNVGRAIEDFHQRKAIKEMLRSWEKTSPGRLETIFASLQNVVPSHLADASLFDFAGLGAERGYANDGGAERCADHSDIGEPDPDERAPRRTAYGGLMRAAPAWVTPADA